MVGEHAQEVVTPTQMRCSVALAAVVLTVGDRGPPMLAITDI
jgi:hypothetical protein